MAERSGERGRAVPAGKLTFEEFLAWCDEDTWAEWLDGEVQMVSPASRRHQALRGFLAAVLIIYVERRALGGVLGAPFLMRLANVPSGREPDVLFVAAEHQDRLRETYLEGPADLVVEIVSPESRLRDRGEKFAEYELGGVREYWLLDPEQRRADFYRLDAEGRYQRAPVDPDGIYRSEVLPGFGLRVAWCWQAPLPPVLAALRELGLLA
ncbi:MAG: Uma2 family endonuclease [Candidatus Rokubacteria bacterium]|nr:Uma2 family endonuclease [Candidatus Rokubacteria bacterium]